jgi:D-alanyl-D-alanine dipeptidase
VLPASLNESTTQSADIVDLTMIDPLLNLDIRYAADDNIFQTPLYEEARALLQRPIAEALFRVQQKVRRMGMGLIIYDTYQPWHVTRTIWQKVPDSLRYFFEDPSRGSCQNRGAAISLSLYDLESTELLPMPTDYGDISSQSISDFPILDNRLRWNRDLLRRLMESEGFTVSHSRWWHFNHQSCAQYPALDIPFAEMESSDEMNPGRIYTVD